MWNNDNEKFTESVFDVSSALDNAIDWISDNLNPEDVFPVSDLETWAEENNYIKEDE